MKTQEKMPLNKLFGYLYLFKESGIRNTNKQIYF